jgi:hypothetical protein
MRAPSTLRDRITEPMMDDITEQVMKTKNRGLGFGGGDPRPIIIRAIRRIAEFEQLSPSQLHKRYETITTLSKKLRAAVRGTEFADIIEVLDRIDRDSSRQANAAARSVGPSGGAITVRMRKDLAARLAFNLLENYGGATATLSKDGTYVTLANRLYEAATGDDRDRINLVAACSRHFKELKKEGLDAYSPRGRRRTPSNDESEVGWLMRADAVSERIRRVDELRRSKLLKPLDELLDEMLG